MLQLFMRLTDPVGSQLNMAEN